MTKTRTVLVLLVVCAALASWWVLSGRNATASETIKTTTQVRWLVSHRPVDVFTRATDVFAKELATRSNGSLELVIVTPEQLGLNYSGDVPESKLEELLKSGAVDIVSPYTIPLGTRDSNFWSLNLPFLFNDYAQVDAALDGKAGETILSGLAKKMDAHGLAFTMSGGFRIIASKHMNMSTLSDWKGKKIATSGGPVAEATIQALGATPVAIDLEGTQADLSAVDGVETTYARLANVINSDTAFTSHISETNHSVFLTALIVSDALYSSLSPDEQQALTGAARTAAALEREDSIALNATTKSSLEAKGSEITTLDESARTNMRRAVQEVYEKYEPTFGSDLLNQLSSR
jgi:TRAP-type transport system periplasmic protein